MHGRLAAVACALLGAAPAAAAAAPVLERVTVAQEGTVVRVDAVLTEPFESRELEPGSLCLTLDGRPLCLVGGAAGGMQATFAGRAVPGRVVRDGPRAIAARLHPYALRLRPGTHRWQA